MNFPLLFYFISVVFCVSLGYGDETHDKVIRKFLENIEASHYDKRTPPSPTPVKIDVTSYILDVYKMNDVDMELSVQFYFRQSWDDPRLNHTHEEDIVMRDEKPIWTPDLFFIEERQGLIHTVIHPNMFIRIKKNGNVMMSVRVTVRFNCQMDLRNYPHDVQTCTLNAESYGFSRKHMDLVWRNVSEGNPLGFSEKIDMLAFDLIDVQPGSKVSPFTFGEYTSLQIHMTFQRKFGFFITRMYVPLIILVLLSTFSFCIKAEEKYLRLAFLLVIIYLTVTISTDVNVCTPPTTYTKAIDVWLAFCQSMVFAAFMEFIIVALIDNKDAEKFKGEIIPTLDADAKENILSTDSAKAFVTKQFNMFIGKDGGNGKKPSYHIDRKCRIVFPIIFLLFNVIFWCVYGV